MKIDEAKETDYTRYWCPEHKYNAWIESGPTPLCPICEQPMELKFPVFPQDEREAKVGEG
jgi:hypothetical protein